MLQSRNALSCPKDIPERQQHRGVAECRVLTLEGLESPRVSLSCSPDNEERESFDATVIRKPDLSQSTRALVRFLESQHVCEDYIGSAKIEEFMRRNLCVWLDALNTHFKFSPGVYFTCISYVDTVLGSVAVQPKYLQCLGVAAFNIAAKVIEEPDDQPSPEELVENSGGQFKATDISRMERLILSKLDWKLRPVTSLTLLHEMFAVLPLDLLPVSAPQILADAAKKLRQCTFEYELMMFKPATLAVSVLIYELESRFRLDAGEATLFLEDRVDVDVPRYLECLEIVQDCLVVATSDE